ncbi:hypothetical protein EDB81DRAFT_654148 [Dactylonectria macrodidyma]|uniref:Uncharacterized protein n=1 Tax=Dactylonectria macrodidyma TaxID=307937 RepID=A0A9P9ERV6_9HYPO|nr:hypothetical protein EDB81DRAFT_654148 [Dactylonectria macrodidyma]
MEVKTQQTIDETDCSGHDQSTVAELLRGDQTTPDKATALIKLLESSRDTEPDQEGDSSSTEEYPWEDIVVAHETVVENLEHGNKQVDVAVRYARRSRKRRKFLSPWTVIKSIGKSCSEAVKTARRATGPDENDQREVENGPEPEAVPQKLEPAPVNRFELYLKKALFEETVHASTTLSEPEWKHGLYDQNAVPLFPGWNAAVVGYPLRPQGRFVAETKQAFDSFLDNFEIGGNVQVMGTGGGLSATGLPGMLKRSFTPYQWLGMWRSSGDRGDLPPPRIVKIINQERHWKGCGSGWRQAFKIPQLSNEYSSGEGLVATIPQIVGLLHLQHSTLTDLQSSPALTFDTPLNIGNGQLCRGVMLSGRPQGYPHVGANTKIAVLFPSDSAWVKEQFLWA